MGNVYGFTNGLSTVDSIENGGKYLNSENFLGCGCRGTKGICCGQNRVKSVKYPGYKSCNHCNYCIIEFIVLFV